MVLLAVDIGGTFTDVVAIDPATGAYHAAKVPTTPRRLIEGVRDGTRVALELAGARPSDVERFVHGTTIGTNAVLERRGATTAVLATEGFEDSLEIGRLRRTRMYDLFMDAETPVFLAPRRRRRGLAERIAADGAVVKPLDERCVIDTVRELRDEEGATAFAVSLLFSFRNPAHEQRVRAHTPARPCAQRVAVQRGRPHVPRVRAHRGHRVRRLHPAGHPALRHRPRRRARADRHRGAPADHAVARWAASGSSRRLPPAK